MFRLGLQIFQGLKPQELVKSLKHAQNYACICSYQNWTKNSVPGRNFQTTCDLYNSCGKEKKKLCVKKASMDDHPRIVQLLHDMYFKDEPVLKALLKGNVCPEFEDYFLKDICEGSSLLAVGECDKLAGVAINGTLLPTDLQDLLQMAQCTKDTGMAKLFTFHAHIEKEANLWCELKVEKMLYIRTLATANVYRKQGVSKILIEKSIEEARKRCFPIVRIDCTSVYCAKAAESLCMKLVYKLDYKDYVDQCKRPIFEPECPHDTLKVYVLELCK